tara:strand:- start:60 stop:287 length:228 start_codon:yes stop_codon:yes gene_type:complete
MITRSRSKTQGETLKHTILEKNNLSHKLSKTRSGRIYSNFSHNGQHGLTKYKNIKIRANEIDYYAKILLSLRDSL